MADPTPDVIKGWVVGPIPLELHRCAGGQYSIVPQTTERNLLSTLARVGTPGVSLCALDIVFRFGYKCLDIRDALAAYSESPLEEAPPGYVEVARSLDWRSNLHTENHKAIVLAGSKNESDRRLLLEFLENAKEDSRDGPLYAASSFDDHVFVQKLACIAMSLDKRHAGATGELGILREAFRRWLRRKTIDEKTLGALLKQNEEGRTNSFSAARMLSYLQ